MTKIINSTRNNHQGGNFDATEKGIIKMESKQRNEYGDHGNANRP